MIFSPIERQAFCVVHNNKCCYCSRVIHPHDTQLDHIIPQSTNNLKELKKKYSLSSDFEIHGYENILPSCAICNKKKSNSLDTSIAILLGQANKKKERIESEVKKLDKKYKKSKVVECTIPFRLEFKDKIKEGFVNKSILVDFEEIPVKMLNSHIKSLTLHNEEDEKREVKNISEYREAKKEGYFAKSTYDIKDESSFVEMNAILFNLEIATFPQVCWFSNQDFHFNDLNLIDSSIANIFVNIDGYFLEPKQTLKPISELVDLKKIRVIENDAQNLHFEYDGYGKKIKELLRGDFTKTGYEEILCSVYEYSIEGTLGVPYTVILKKSESGSLAHAKLIFY